MVTASVVVEKTRKYFMVSISHICKGMLHLEKFAVVCIVLEMVKLLANYRSGELNEFLLVPHLRKLSNLP